MSQAACLLAAGLRGLTRRRVAVCRCIRTSPTVQLIERQHRTTGATRLVLQGISTCGSVHSCPMCAERILTGRAEDVTAAVRAHGHKRLAMVTFTLRHARGNSLYVLRRLLTDAYSGMKSGRSGTALRESLRYVGDLRGSEVTHGRNGWHPHLHALWFVGGQLDKARMQRALRAAWSESVARTYGTFEDTIRRGLEGDEKLSLARARAVFGSRYFRAGASIADAAKAFQVDFESLGGWAELITPDDAHGVDVQECDPHAGRYISKLGLEVAAVNKKSGKTGESRTSWQIANDAAAGDLQSRALWAEHAAAMFGARQLTWSRGLRDALGLCPERSDEEYSADLIATAEEDERLLGEIEGDDWDKAARELKQTWAARLHDAHAAGQLSALAVYRERVTPYDNRPPLARPPPREWWEDIQARTRGRRHACAPVKTRP